MYYYTINSVLAKKSIVKKGVYALVWETEFTKKFGVKYPIVQGGLAYLAYSDLASAVSNAGGLGQITAMSLSSPDDLRKEIERTRSLTDQPFGVNFAIGAARRPFKEMVQVAIDEEVDAISITGGNPQPILQMVQKTSIKTLVLVAARRQAEKAEELGADAVMVVGQEGGGHIGRDDTGTFVLTPLVAETVSIPVLASGGIVDGKGLMAALALGADGIEMGTRFIATKECVHAHEVYKEAIVKADEHATAVIKRSFGAPARVFKGDMTEKILEIEKVNGTYEALKDYISGKANRRYIHDGVIEEGIAYAGQGAARIHDIPTVEQLMNQIIREAEEIRKKWQL